MQAQMHLLRRLAAPTSALAPQQASWESAALRRTAQSPYLRECRHQPHPRVGACVLLPRPPQLRPFWPGTVLCLLPLQLLHHAPLGRSCLHGAAVELPQPGVAPCQGGGWGEGEDQSVRSVLAGKWEVDGSGISTHCVLGP